MEKDPKGVGSAVGSEVAALGEALEDAERPEQGQGLVLDPGQQEVRGQRHCVGTAGMRAVCGRTWPWGRSRAQDEPFPDDE